MEWLWSATGGDVPERCERGPRWDNDGRSPRLPPRWHPSLEQAVTILAVAVEQDVATEADGMVDIAQRVASDRVVSVADPQMRHGRKTSSHQFDGRKGHVRVQPATPAQRSARPGTAVEVTGPRQPDGARLPPSLKARKARTGFVPCRCTAFVAPPSAAALRTRRGRGVFPVFRRTPPVPTPRGRGHLKQTGVRPPTASVVESLRSWPGSARRFSDLVTGREDRCWCIAKIDPLYSRV